jgi:hypothetical protein
MNLLPNIYILFIYYIKLKSIIINLKSQIDKNVLNRNFKILNSKVLLQTSNYLAASLFELFLLVLPGGLLLTETVIVDYLLL